MCLGSEDDFFGGYDHFFGGYDHERHAGVVHWADHRIAPGTKQWTRGNSPFGWAWDANLTDGDGPYVELMAGVYTDNQPDFSFLAPGETKTFSQYWYPIVDPGETTTTVRVEVAVTAVQPGLDIAILDVAGETLWARTVGADPATPLVDHAILEGHHEPADLTVLVTHHGLELLRWRHRTEPASSTVPDAAIEPPAPPTIATVEELYLTGLHLEQYRHATRSPEPYWREALARDPHDVRTNTALAARLVRAARYSEALPNGETRYRLGQVLARTARPDEAYDAFAKAAWNAAWRTPAHLAMARLDASRGRDVLALRHARAVLDHDSQHLQARDITVHLLRRLGHHDEASELLAQTLLLDPLDRWARDLAGDHTYTDGPTGIDIALEYASRGDVLGSHSVAPGFNARVRGDRSLAADAGHSLQCPSAINDRDPVCAGGGEGVASCAAGSPCLVTALDGGPGSRPRSYAAERRARTAADSAATVVPDRSMVADMNASSRRSSPSSR